LFSKVNKLKSLKINFFSSYFSNAAIALLGIIFVPIYLKYISAEGYGLIGVFTSLQVVLSVLDGGLGGALTREIASRSSNTNSDISKTNNLVKTLEIVYWIIAAVVSLIAILLSPLLATYWVQPVNLSGSEITKVFSLLSLSLIFLFPIGFYSGGMIGLQKHLILNVLKVSFALLKNVGSVLVLIFMEEKLLSFFTWNLILTAFQAVTFKYVLWKCLGKSPKKPVFDKMELRAVSKYALGITGISITALILTQIDRIILSKVLLLDQFGYYTLACSLAVFIFQIIQPINQSFFPKFVTLISSQNTVALKENYRLAYQIASLLIIPAFLILAFFSEELLLLVTHDAQLSLKTKMVLSVLAVGNGLNSLLNVPHQLSLANGWTKYAFYQNLLLIFILTPLTIWLSLKYGALGGASSWLILNIIILFAGSWVIHKRLLKNEFFNWFIYGFSLPLFLNALFLFFMRRVITWDGTHKITTIAITFTYGFICLALNSLLLPEIRKRIKQFNFLSYDRRKKK